MKNNSNPKCWNFYNISIFDCLTFEYIEKNINKNWNWSIISGKTKYIMKFLNKYPEKIDYNSASFNENLDLKYVEKHSNKNWNWCLEGFGSNTTLTLNFLKKFENKFEYDNGIYLQDNPNFDISWLEELDFCWNMKKILKDYKLVKR